MLEVFQYQDTPVRTVAVDGEPWFVLADLCRVLGIKNVKDTRDRLSDGVDQTYPIDDSMGRSQMTTIVSEPGMYEVVLRSDRPEAVDFRRWVTSEVLPTIRKHGGYLTEKKIEEVLTSPDTIIRLAQDLKQAQKARDAMESYARELEPKADAYTRFIDADGTYAVGTVAKMLGLSQNKLFDRLRGGGIFIGKGPMRNTPYQQYMHHFAVKAYEYERTNGTRGTSYTTRVLGTGVEFIARKLGLEVRAVS